jgi:hypothetical protein
MSAPESPAVDRFPGTPPPWRLLAAVVTIQLAVIAGLVFATRLDREPPPVTAHLPRQLVGVQLHPFFTGQTDAINDREMDIAKKAGADTIRVDLVWSSLQLTGPGPFDPDVVARVDRVLDQARRRGLHVVLMFWSTPCWASTAPESLKQGCEGSWWDRGVTAYPPTDPKLYADAAAEVARRWGDDIVALEIWNEPNFEQFLAGPDPARSYGAMLRAAYPRIKAIRPHLPVLAGSMALADGRFLERLFADRGIAGHYDAVSWHPYTDPDGPLASADRAGRENSFAGGAAWLRRIMARNGDTKGELWATEAGASTCQDGANPRCVSPQTQAERIRDYIVAARSMPWLRALIIYNLRDKGTDANDPEDGFGLVRADFSAKPSLAAFSAAHGR